MSDDYLDAFVTESRMELRRLNSSLLALEAAPEDRAALNDVFRAAHTLKGNFDAMGFEDASDLARAVEDLLDAIRAGDVEVTSEVIDHMFAGADRLEAAVDEIDEQGATNVDVEATIDRLRDVLDGETQESNGATVTEGATGDSAAADTPHVRATVTIDDREMPGVDGLLVLDAAEDDFDVLGSTPDREAIRSGEFDASFDLVIDDTDPDAVSETLAAQGPVADVDAALIGEGEREPRRSRADAENDTDAGTATGRSADIDTVRVGVEKLDTLHDLVERLAASRIKLRQNLDDGDTEAALEVLDDLDVVSSHLQDAVLEMRLVPLDTVVGKFPRLVRDLAREQGKQVEFEIQGRNIKLDRTTLTEIRAPLMHLLRNAVDHGIEPPSERAAAGKPETGHIELRAQRERDHVIIAVEDDGAGIDANEIREAAVDAGVRSREAVESMDDEEVYDLVFAAGLSTAGEVTDVSGRGVGMDVVQQAVDRLDGTLDVDSDPGEGTRVLIRLPASVALVQVLFVRVGDATVGVPTANVDEVAAGDGVKTVNGDRVVEHGDDRYPVVDLHTALDDIEGTAATASSGREDSKLVRVQSSRRAIALRCDAVETRAEVVVKPLEGILRTEGIAGTAVRGDGTVIPILDVTTLGDND